MKKMTIVLVLLLLCAVVYAAEDVNDLELKVEKIKDDLNKNPKLFQDYAKAKFGVGAKVDLIGGAKLENGMLVHPKGGKLDLSTLSRLPGLTGVTMLADGQFKFSFANNEIKASGIDKIQATDKGLLLDGVEVRPNGRLGVRKTSEGYSLIGTGTVVADGKTFDIKTLGTKAALLDYHDGKAYSIRMPADEKGGSSLGYNKHTLVPLKESMTLYLDKSDYDSFKGNKAFIGEKVYLSNAGGKVAVDGYYMFTDGKVAMIRGAKGTAPMVSYTYNGNPVALQSTVPLASAKKYQSISQLFKDNGYGEGSKNYAAREALYKQYFGEGYKGYSQQNRKMLEAIQKGDIPLLAKGDMTYETMPTGVTETVKDAASQTVRTASVKVASSILSSIPSTRRFVPSSTQVDEQYRNILGSVPAARTIAHSSNLGQWKVVNGIPQGADVVDSEVTDYYTPKWDPTKKDPDTHTSKSKFNKDYGIEGSKLVRQADGSWIGVDSDGDTFKPAGKLAMGQTSSGSGRFIGGFAAPAEVPMGSIIGVSLADGNGYLVGIKVDTGGRIVVKKSEDGETAPVYKFDKFDGFKTDYARAGGTTGANAINRKGQVWILKPGTPAYKRYLGLV